MFFKKRRIESSHLQLQLLRLRFLSFNNLSFYLIDCYDFELRCYHFSEL
jgi:hypothetical protein